ncbi:MAG: Asp-tRNA(Asn)/Glu-tRNA(Gln) amidotransferase subunit GatC [Firmicutes bacterium]|nr:Asp-tRNA(Asn)/Glu-tRNA(Gln) amidotransferase subunit GatC [Bacillota bacterium]
MNALTEGGAGLSRHEDQNSPRKLMNLTEEEVRHVARLARLAISSTELSEATQALGRVLDYIDLLNELDTEAVPPTTHVEAIETVWRQDRVVPSLSPEEATANGPQVSSHMFVVPKILDGGEG